MKLTLLPAVLATASLSAQDPHLARPDLPRPDDAWLVPIHTAPDDPTGGAYGTWAAGPDYKVAFDDGFTFYPVLGESYPENRPVRWRTHRIESGAQVLVDATTTARRVAHEWRYELHYPGGIVEAYDVRREGVEQSFVLPSRPASSGDIVVTGSFLSSLAPVEALSADGGIAFADASGLELVRYGKAIAFDATGRRTDVPLERDGDVVRLRVPAAFADSAVFPLTIDPLTSRIDVGIGSSAPSYPTVARDDDANQLLLVYSRASSASDYDMRGRLTQDTFAPIASAFADLTAQWSTRHSSVAWVAGADRWAIALGREFQASAGVRVYVHASGNTTENSGATIFVNEPVWASDRFPTIGGNRASAADPRAYLVFEREGYGAGAPGVTRVYGTLVDVVALTVTTPSSLHDNPGVTNYDAEAPCITQDAQHSGSWMVVWQEFNHANANDDWDVIAQRIARDGTPGGSNAVLGQGSDASLHKLYPSVAGSNGRYLVTWLTRANTDSAASLTGSEYFAQRFDWQENWLAPTVSTPRSIVATPGNALRASFGSRPIAYDHNTESHWAFAWRDTANDIHAVRLGWSGRVVEQVVVFSAVGPIGVSPSICYNDDAYEFPIAYGTTEAGSNANPVGGARLQYFDTAIWTLHGPGCTGSIRAVNRGQWQFPYAGSEFFGIELYNAYAGAPTFLMVAALPGSLPLPGGCTLNLDTVSLIQAAGGVSDANGRFRFDIALPDDLTVIDLHWQFLQIHNGALSATQGLLTSVR